MQVSLCQVSVSDGANNVLFTKSTALSVPVFMPLSVPAVAQGTGTAEGLVSHLQLSLPSLQVVNWPMNTSQLNAEKRGAPGWDGLQDQQVGCWKALKLKKASLASIRPRATQKKTQTQRGLQEYTQGGQRAEAPGTSRAGSQSCTCNVSSCPRALGSWCLHAQGPAHTQDAPQATTKRGPFVLSVSLEGSNLQGHYPPSFIFHITLQSKSIEQKIGSLAFIWKRIFNEKAIVPIPLSLFK